MGAMLVSRTFAYAVDVPLRPNEKHLLLFMALTALDTDSTPRYFASREESAIALGRRVPDAAPRGEPDAPERVAALEAVKVAIRGLVKLDAIVQLKRAYAGVQRPEFELCIDIARTRKTDEFRERVRKAQPSPIRRLSLPESKAQPSGFEGSAFPQGTTGTKGTTGGRTSPNETTSLEPVDNFAKGEAA